MHIKIRKYHSGYALTNGVMAVSCNVSTDSYRKEHYLY